MKELITLNLQSCVITLSLDLVFLNIYIVIILSFQLGQTDTSCCITKLFQVSTSFD